MSQTVDFQKAFSQAAGVIASMGLTILQFQRDAQEAFEDESNDDDVRQAAKGAIVLATMVREMIKETLISLREPLMAGAPDHLKDALKGRLDQIDQLRRTGQE